MLVNSQTDNYNMQVFFAHLERSCIAPLWNEDFELALSNAERILGQLTSAELRGYRALWEYLAGSSAYLARLNGFADYDSKIREHFDRAKKAARDVPWLVGLYRYSDVPVERTEQDDLDSRLLVQVENIERLLSSLGSMHDRKLANLEKKIREGLNSENEFEEAHRLVGEHIGFEACKVEEEASPDPWWQISDLCFVFEDHANAQTDTLKPEKARQVQSHPNWMRENVTSCATDDVTVIPVLLSPVTKVTKGGAPHLGEVAYWNLDEFKQWSESALAFIREIRSTFQEPGDLAWRAETASKLIQAKLDINSIKAMLEEQMCRDVLDVVG